MSNVIHTPTITHAAALKLIETTIEEGASRGVRVCVTVVDPALGLVAMTKADGTTPHSVETSRRKANTAASTRKATGWMQGDFATALPLGTGLLLTNIKGGYPVIFEDAVVAGFGVAGGTPDQDAEIAEAVLARVGATVPAQA